LSAIDRGLTRTHNRPDSGRLTRFWKWPGNRWQRNARPIQRLEGAHLLKRTRSTEDERQVLISLTSQGQALREKARTVPEAILAASACSLSELSAMKNELIALRDRLNAAAGEGART